MVQTTQIFYLFEDSLEEMDHCQPGDFGPIMAQQMLWGN